MRDRMSQICGIFDERARLQRRSAKSSERGHALERTNAETDSTNASEAQEGNAGVDMLFSL